MEETKRKDADIWVIPLLYPSDVEVVEAALEDFLGE